MKSFLARVLALAAVTAVGIAPATGNEAAEETPVLRVGTSGDYAPFSLASGENPAEYEYAGFDIELARRYAADRGLAVRFVPFRWPGLLEDLEAGRFDVAMSGVTVRPERSVAGSFALPVLETGAVALVPKETWTDLDALDRPHIRIGVNAGGHLERVSASRFPRATRISIRDNASVLEALRQGTVQAVVTDSAEAPHWLEQMEGLVTLGPFTLDRKAPLVRADRAELAADLDRWLLERERDGMLEALREKHVGPGPWRTTAEPLAALLASMDERLALMPTVGFVKRDTGVPIEVLEREEVVLDAASEIVLEVASVRDVVPPPVISIRRFFRAQMEAAKQVQLDAVADREFVPPAPLPDLDEDLRPALLRIGARIARLMLELPPGLPAERVRSEAEKLLREPRLSRSSRRMLVKAIVDLVPTLRRGPDQTRVKTRASSPAATGNTTQAP